MIRTARYLSEVLSLLQPADKRVARVAVVAILIGSLHGNTTCAAPLRAGVAKVDITDREVGPVNDPLFVKALVLKSDTTTAVLITLDAVAVGEIGRIKNDYLPNLRSRLEKELGIAPTNVLVNASHCHGIVCADVEQRSFLAVKAALQDLVEVKIGAGVGQEDRIMENRRLRLKSGREADVRHAYSLPPDDEVAEVGPVDPQIGILRVDRQDGRALAVVYNFACHPIQGVPSGANTADIVGFASKVIEENLSEGTMALFLQGCAGDINPIDYKDVDHPRSAEPLGNMLGLSTLRACRKIRCREDGRLTVAHGTIELPRGDRSERIIAMEAEQSRLLGSLKGTSLNLKTFLPLVVKYDVSGEFPSYYSHRYLHDVSWGRDDLTKLDAENRRNIQQYVDNIHVMEELTRLQTNLALLRKHQASLVESGKRTVTVELLAVRIGDFVLATFPGELTVRIGMNIKRNSPHQRTFVAGYTNGYIYYAPTAEQLGNLGGAQEDSDCILAPEWQKIYEDRAAAMLKNL
ncbi:MAG TPA: hypothetical protein VG125_29545 [Pirellulales bacterium]|jgi:hypothetical protein|nr:hypothetical protein [Pirellulales bacterium]